MKAAVFKPIVTSEISPIRLGILGIRGRLGQAVEKQILNFSSSSSSSSVPPLRMTSAPLRGESFASLLTQTDVILDVASPEAFLELLQLHASAPFSESPLPPCVIGSTGWSPSQYAQLLALAESGTASLLMASNFSIGIALLQEVLASFGPLFQSLGYTPSLEEAHHIHKKDQPSGTAWSLRRVLRPSCPESVPCQSFREGEVLGEHKVIFEHPLETLALMHTAKDRSLFAEGALRLVQWFDQKRRLEPTLPLQKRLFSMSDYLRDFKKGEMKR